MGARDWWREKRFGFVDGFGESVAPQDGQKIYINGVGTSKGEAIAQAFDPAYGVTADVLAYNPTTNFIADMTESVLSRLTFTSSVSRQMSGQLFSLQGISLVGHSQGSIIASNTLLNLGLRGSRSAVNDIRFLASAISQPQAYLSAAIGGINSSNVHFSANTFDLINLVGPNFNPIKLGGGALGAANPFFGLSQHSLKMYGVN